MILYAEATPAPAPDNWLACLRNWATGETRGPAEPAADGRS